MPSVQKVRQWYVDSFSDLYEVSLKGKEDVAVFTEKVKKVLKRHQNTMQIMGKGVYELKNALQHSTFAGVDDLSEFVELHQSLSKFFIFILKKTPR
jgi:hypothetical protein